VVTGLESARLKLDRAAVHIDAVKKAVGEYIGSEPGVITEDANGKPTLNFRSLPPPEISILAGEALYQMRSALDHLAFDLVKLNAMQIQLPAAWEKRCEFPLLTEVPIKGNLPVPWELPLPYNFFDRCLPGISKGAFAFIERLQPHYRRNGSSQLWFLAKLANIDKHRHLNLTKPQAYVRIDAVWDGFHHSSVIRTDNGAEVEIPFPKGVKVAGGFTPVVSFDETLGIEETGLTVDHLLKFCLEGVEMFILPAFSEFLKKP
jgi:hypothetical protein